MYVHSLIEVLTTLYAVFHITMQTEPTDEAVVATVMEITNVIRNSSRTVQDLMIIEGLIDRVADVLSINLSIRNEVSTKPPMSHTV